MSKRTAALNLEWEQDGDDYVAQLPAIPGYPEMHDEESLVYVAPVGDGYTFWMEIAVLKSEFIKLTDLNFNLPNAKTADEMMQEVDSLTIQDILDALSAVGCGPIDATASRKATRRTAHMDLDWEKEDTGDYYAAALPDIPGYPNPKGGPYHAEVYPDTVTTSGGWMLYISMRPGVDLYEQDFGIQPTKTAEEMMQAVDNLSVEDIVDALEANGKEPWGGDDTTASRKAHFDLEWEKEEDGSYFAPLPYSYDAYVYDAATVRGSSQTGWRFQITDGYYILDDTDFGIPAASTAKEAMDEVEDLTFEVIDKKMSELFPEQ